jgi:hypothetical protein
MEQIEKDKKMAGSKKSDKADDKKEKEVESTTSSSDEDNGLSQEDIKKIQALIKE